VNAGREDRPPRGALAVVAVGLLATVFAALLSTDKPLGAAELEWESKAPLPDARPVAIPGGGEMRLGDAGIRVTEANESEYRLYRVAAVLTIDPGSAIGQGQLRCGIRVPPRTIVAKTINSRASYPRSSEELDKQPTPEEGTILVEFNSHSTDLAALEMGDALGERYTREPGIVVEWAPYKVGQQVWQWGFPPGRPTEPLTLPFASIWRTTATPAAKISCTITTGAGSATVRTAGSLG
jgi:hypothetical protein